MPIQNTGWAYVSCSVSPVAGAQGCTGSLQFYTGSSGLSGSCNLVFYTGSSPNLLALTGNLDVSGTITARNYDVINHTITYMSSSGASKFGDSTDDLHQFTGSIQTSGAASSTLFRVDGGATSPVIFVTGSGRVAIGHDSPNYALSVNGYVELGNGSGTGYVVSRGDVDTYLRFGVAGADSIALVAGGNQLLTLDENGTDKVILGSSISDITYVSGNFSVCEGTASIAHLSGCSTINVYSPISSSQPISASNFVLSGTGSYSGSSAYFTTLTTSTIVGGSPLSISASTTIISGNLLVCDGTASISNLSGCSPIQVHAPMQLQSGDSLSFDGATNTFKITNNGTNLDINGANIILNGAVSSSGNLTASAFYFGPGGRQVISDNGTDMSILAATTPMAIGSDAGPVILQGVHDFNTTGYSSSVFISASAFVGDGSGITGISLINLDAAGSDTNVQFNQNGEFAADAGLAYDGTGSITVSGALGTAEYLAFGGLFQVTESYGAKLTLGAYGSPYLQTQNWYATSSAEEAEIGPFNRLNIVQDGQILISSSADADPDFEIPAGINLVCNPGNGIVEIETNRVSFLHNTASLSSDELEYIWSINSDHIEDEAAWIKLDMDSKEFVVGSADNIQLITNAGLQVDNAASTFNSAASFNAQANFNAVVTASAALKLDANPSLTNPNLWISSSNPAFGPGQVFGAVFIGSGSVDGQGQFTGASLRLVNFGLGTDLQIRSAAGSAIIRSDAGDTTIRATAGEVILSGSGGVTFHTQGTFNNATAQFNAGLTVSNTVATIMANSSLQNNGVSTFNDTATFNNSASVHNQGINVNNARGTFNSGLTVNNASAIFNDSVTLGDSSGDGVTWNAGKWDMSANAVVATLKDGVDGFGANGPLLFFTGSGGDLLKFSTSGSRKGVVFPTTFYPSNDGGADIGDSTYRFGNLYLGDTAVVVDVSASSNISASAFYFGPNGRNVISDTGTDMSILAESTAMFISADGGSVILQGQVNINQSGVLSSSQNISASNLYVPSGKSIFFDSNETFKITNNGTNLDINGANIILNGAVSSSGNLSASAFYGDGSNLTGVSASPGGSDTQIQYNDSTSFNGDSVFVWVKGDKMCGVGTSAPAVALDVHYTGSAAPTSLSNDEGGGEVVYFGTGSGPLTTGALYFLNKDGGWASGSAVSTGSGHNQLLGISLGAKPAENGMLIKGFFDADTYYTGSFIKGGPVYMQSGSSKGYLSGAAPTAGDSYVRVVGYGTDTANVIYFNPDSTYVELT